MPSRAHRLSFSQDSLEQIRCLEVTRILKKMNPSPEEAEAIERLSRLLVDKLLLGPISDAMTHAETWGLRTGELDARFRRAYERVAQVTDDP